MRDNILLELSKIIDKDRNTYTKIEFIKYILKHPDERFWQSVRNFSEYPFIIASTKPVKINITGEIRTNIDTFYWENNNG